MALANNNRNWGTDAVQNSNPSICSSLRAISAALMLFWTTQVAIARAEELPINIASGAADESLKEFVRQTQFQVLYESDAINAYQTHAVSGQYKPVQALSQMLSGTPLAFQRVNSRTVVISTTNGRSNASEPISTADAGNTRSPILLAETSPHTRSNGSEKTQDAAQPGSDEHKVLKALQEVVITGTNLRDATNSSPLKVYSRKEIESSGVSSIEQFARVMPENFSSMNSSTAQAAGGNVGFQLVNNGYHGAGFNLHGMGANSTLVLLDGQRLPGAGSDAGFTDVSMIPLSAIERIEVTTDGASAVYGADAVAGVVNLRLRRDYEGAQSTLKYGGATDGGAGEFRASQLLGTSWTSGNALLTYEHLKNDGLLDRDRSFVTPSVVPAHILPEQASDNFVVNGRQQLAEKLSLSATGMYGRREFAYDSLGAFSGALPVSRYTTGDVRLAGGSLSLSREFSHDWQADLSARYSDQRQSINSALFGTTDPALLTPDPEIIESSTVSEFEMKTAGKISITEGLTARAALGVSFRHESLDSTVTGTPLALKRDTSGVFGELLLPLVSERHSTRLLRSLDLSLALRRDHYSDTDSSTNPKIGLTWVPGDGVSVKATYSTSFQPPLLHSLNSTPFYLVFRLPDPTATGGVTTTLLDFSSGNPTLRPQNSRSYTFGVDIQPTTLEGLHLSLNYFDTSFEDRILSPPLAGSFFTLYSQAQVLAPFIDRSPDPAYVQSLFDTGKVINLSGGGPGGVQAIFDGRITNLASTRQSGFDLSGRYGFNLSSGEWSVSLSTVYLTKNDIKVAPTTPEISFLSEVGQPLKFRARGELGWALRNFDAAFAVNFAQSYTNQLTTPESDVASWTTADIYLRYQTRMPSRLSRLDNLSVSLSAQNLLGAEPPHVSDTTAAGAGGPGYDGANATPIGRMLSLQVGLDW